MRALLPTIAVAMLLLLATGATARDIHVDNERGDDRATGEGLEVSADGNGPVRTLGQALRLAQKGDRIVMAATGRPYRESVTLAGGRHSGDADQPFAIAGNGAILDGSAPVPPKAWQHYRENVFRFQPRRVGHQQLLIDGRPAPRVKPADGSSEAPKLDPGQWCLHRGYIYFAVDQDKAPSDYALSYAEKSVGITLFRVRHVAIADLTVQGFQLDGINAHNDARAVALLRVTARGNGRAGIAVGGACQMRIVQCLLGDNAVAQLLALPRSETYVSDSELLDKTAPAWLDRGGRIIIDGKPVESEAKPAKEPA